MHCSAAIPKNVSTHTAGHHDRYDVALSSLLGWSYGSCCRVQHPASAAGVMTGTGACACPEYAHVGCACAMAQGLQAAPGSGPGGAHLQDEPQLLGVAVAGEQRLPRRHLHQHAACAAMQSDRQEGPLLTATMSMPCFWRSVPQPTTRRNTWMCWGISRGAAEMTHGHTACRQHTG